MIHAVGVHFQFHRARIYQQPAYLWESWKIIVQTTVGTQLATLLVKASLWT